VQDGTQSKSSDGAFDVHTVRDMDLDHPAYIVINSCRRAHIPSAVLIRVNMSPLGSRIAGPVRWRHGLAVTAMAPVACGSVAS
jgi:hypothetical protein